MGNKNRVEGCQESDWTPKFNKFVQFHGFGITCTLHIKFLKKQIVWMTFGNKRKKRLQNDAKIFVSNIFSSEKYCLPNFDWVKKMGH